MSLAMCFPSKSFYLFEGLYAICSYLVTFARVHKALRSVLRETLLAFASAAVLALLEAFAKMF